MEGLKLFQVNTKFMDPHLSMLLTHGGTSGGSHEGMAFVPASSRQEAISTVWEQMLFTAEARQTRNSELLAKKRAGTLEKQEEHLFTSPRTPCQRDRWTANEVVVSGYQIICTPSPSKEADGNN